VGPVEQRSCMVPVGQISGEDPVGQGSGGPMWSWGLVGLEELGAQLNGEVVPCAYGAGGWQASCFFSRSFCEEDFHKLGVQSAQVLALPGIFTQPSVSPASHQGP
jgi:hypothetical protein